jgi:putative hydrolase of the HAD superfamily
VIEGTFAEALPYELVCDLYDGFATARRWRVLPGAREALALAAGRGVPAAVVSNFDCRLPPLLAELGLGPFAAIVTSTMVGAAKPDPAALLEACRRLGVVPAEVVHVGDSQGEDGAMCAACGARWLRADAQAGIPVAGLRELLDGGRP